MNPSLEWRLVPSPGLLLLLLGHCTGNLLLLVWAGPFVPAVLIIASLWLCDQHLILSPSHDYASLAIQELLAGEGIKPGGSMIPALGLCPHSHLYVPACSPPSGPTKSPVPADCVLLDFQNPIARPSFCRDSKDRTRGSPSHSLACDCAHSWDSP